MTCYRFGNAARGNNLRWPPASYLVLQCLALIAALLVQPVHAATHDRTTFFISPAGSDDNSGLSDELPFKTFLGAFRKMAPGDELILLDGTYSEPAGTGAITYSDWKTGVGGRYSEQVPSGIDESRPTLVRARNPGRVHVKGTLIVGRSYRKDSYIRIQGITFDGGGSLYNTSHVTIKDCGFHGTFGVGTNDHGHGNEHNLIEDVWIWASGERIIAINYRARFNVWRRVIVRGDGCGKTQCRGGGNPNVGITVYDSSNVSLQNVMVVDRILADGDEPYADFAVAQHSPGAHFFGQSEWLGTLSLRAPDTGYYMEPDAGGTVDPTIRIKNAVAWDATYLGMNIARAGTNNLIENVTIKALGGDGIRIAPALTTGILRNALVVDSGRNGINSRYPPSHVDVFGSRESVYRQQTCTTSCYTSNPRTDGAPPSLKHLVRIEPGSFLSGRGHDNGDIGANILYRYGVDGSHFGEEGYNRLTTTPLWPWPNEARIKDEMCDKAGVSRGFCKARSITQYVWEYLGNPMPSPLYPPGGNSAKGKRQQGSARN
jgi:hypothetical protein